MEFILGQNLKKTIRDEIYNQIIKKIYSFSSDYMENNYNISDMKSGWYVREIKGNTKIEKIYKFRVNEKDRIIFTLGRYLGFRNECEKSLVFLEFCNHDEQIRRGRSLNVVNSTSITNIIEEKSDNESEFDLYVNKKCSNYIYNYSTTINRLVSIEEMNEMIKNEDVRAKYYLNDEQFEIIHNNIEPIFLFGSAGSGKTTISIHKACSLCSENIKVGYFTYSEFLKNDAEKIFNNLKDDSVKGNTEFYSINQFFLIKSRKPQIIKYDEFEIWVKNILGMNKNIKAMDIWREIRGILKGLLPIDWINIKIKISSELTEDFLEYINFKKDYAYTEDGYLHIKNGRLAELNSFVLGNYKKDFSREMEFIYTKVDELISQSRKIDKETYLNLSKDYSRFNEEERIKIYSILEKYEDKLINENKIDENDAVRLALKNNEENKKYDFIICDEIQDLSEMEIYFLFKIVKKAENLMFCGDYNQTINPTFFKTERIEAIYKTWKGLVDFNLRLITTNYRSSKSIVDFSNALKDLKRKNLKSESCHDYDEIAIRGNTNKIFIIESRSVEKEVLSILNSQRAYTDILVPNEDEKRRFLDETSRGGIYTVSEYKGLENKYIIGYNILSHFKNKWTEIFECKNNEKISDSELKYYFNLVYVFITRARDNICFIEDDISKEFVSYFKDHIDIINEFSLKKLNLEKISTFNEHYARGKKLERDGRYEKAIDAYKNASDGIFEAERGIKRCQALIDNNIGLHKKAGKSLSEIYEYYHAGQCFIEGGYFEDALKAFVKNDNTYDEIISIFQGVGEDSVAIIDNCNDEKLKNDFNMIYGKHMKSRLSFLCNTIKDMDKGIKKIKDMVKGIQI